jgi:hypothetical protein
MDIGSLLAQFLTLPNITLMVAVSAIIVAVAQVHPPLVQSKLYARGAPFLPLIFCTLVVTFMPSSQWSSMPLGDRILLGVVLGALSGWAYKAFKQTFMGSDDRLDDNVPTLTRSRKNPLGALLLVAAAGGTATVHEVASPAAPEITAPSPAEVTLTSSTSTAARGAL